MEENSTSNHELPRATLTIKFEDNIVLEYDGEYKSDILYEIIHFMKQKFMLEFEDIIRNNITKDEYKKLYSLLAIGSVDGDCVSPLHVLGNIYGK